MAETGFDTMQTAGEDGYYSQTRARKVSNRPVYWKNDD
jgi:hypothetical protein